MTVRMATCTELSKDREAISRLAKHYWDVEKSATAVAVLLPWFPSPAKRTKQRATEAIYDMLLSYITLRRKSSTPSADPIDLFISEGLSDRAIIEVSSCGRSSQHTNVAIDRLGYRCCRSGEYRRQLSVLSFVIVIYKTHEILVQL